MGVVPEGSLGVLTRRGMTGCSPEPGTPAALRILRRGRRLPWVTSGMPPLRALPQAVEVAPGLRTTRSGLRGTGRGACVAFVSNVSGHGVRRHGP